MTRFEPTRHEETFLTLDETATERRFSMPYRKTWDYPGDYLNENHRNLVATLHPTGMIDIGIEGWLLPEDALKLYELAYCCGGDILELGAYRGLSATVMNQAVSDSGRDSVIVSIDLDTTAVDASKLQLQQAPGGERVYFFQDDATSAVRHFASEERPFKFTFVDHSHRYEHVLSACQELHRVIEPGGFALFHDFNDPRNSQEQEVDYGVHQGVTEGLNSDYWEFWGIYGCTGLYRRTGDS